MEKVYYNNLWKGRSAIDKLAREARVSKEKAQAFLRRQKIWQIYLAPPAQVPRPHWAVDQPGGVHQADLLFLPHDKVGRKVYKYALVVVDVASRYKDAEPLTSKSAEEVARAFSRVYSRKLRWPQTLVVSSNSDLELEELLHRSIGSWERPTHPLLSRWRTKEELRQGRAASHSRRHSRPTKVGGEMNLEESPVDPYAVVGANGTVAFKFTLTVFTVEGANGTVIDFV